MLHWGGGQELNLIESKAASDIIESKQSQALNWGSVCAPRFNNGGASGDSLSTSDSNLPQANLVYRKGVSPSGVDEVATPKRDLDSKKSAVCSRSGDNGGLAPIDDNNLSKTNCNISIESSEFSVYSQNGEDGIIDFLLHILDLSAYPRAFVEFGEENYTESNTRFLLKLRNFQGLVIDGSQANIDYIKRDEVYWKHDLHAKCAFITKDNINAIIQEWLDSRDLDNVALLSIDIDGNDYYVWENLTCIAPAIVVIEYNAIFGATQSVSIPYREDFDRFKAHYSGLYFGASIRALIDLGSHKGYAFVGADSSGTNLFFVKREILKNTQPFRIYPLEEYCQRHHARQSRDINGKLSFISHTKRAELIAALPLHSPKPQH